MSASVDEERRAADFRAKERRVAAARRARGAGFAGDGDALARLRDAWEPLRLAIEEARALPDDDPADDRDRE